MKDEILNRVASSPLVTIDLEDFYPKGERFLLDISQWLTEGVVLREKEFRAHLDTANFSQYQDAYVAIHCSTEAILPGWATMLVALHLHGIAKKTVVGTVDDLDVLLFSEIISNLDYSAFKDKSVIVKGCTHKPIPENAYIQLMDNLRPVAKSIMYGEACSSVPLYKRSK